MGRRKKYPDDMSDEQFRLQLKLDMEIKEMLKKPKANHRHNWKDGKKIRVFGALHHIHCAVNGCDEFKVVN
jgi:hypothetical protein